VHVLGSLHEAQRNHVHACGDAEAQVVQILVGQAGRQHGARDVDAFVLTERAAILNAGHDLGCRRGEHPELQVAVVEQHRIARLDHAWELVERGREEAWLAREVTDPDAPLLPRAERQRLAVLERAGANLRTAEILQDGNGPSHAFRRCPQPANHVAVVLVRAVRKVEAEDIDSRGQKPLERGVRVR
jgi:hypothetical protein